MSYLHKKTFTFLKKLPQSYYIYGVPGLYVVIALSLSLWKYSRLLYNQLDLAIFHNALTQPVSNFLFSTIQGHHYLGDHFSPYLLIIKVLYLVFDSPVTLLAVQTLIIAASIVPLLAILKQTLPKKYHLFFVILFFFNPFLLRINLYEFHMYVLLLPLLLSAFYYYQSKNFKLFALFVFLATIVREDAFITVVIFSLLALIERRRLKWAFLPLLSPVYFFVAVQIINLISPSEGNMFLIYYSWLGDSFTEIAKSFFVRFDLVALRLADVRVLEFVGGALAGFVFLPLFKPKYLLFLVPQYLLLAFGPARGFAILSTHYAAPVLFALILASIFGFKHAIRKYRALYKKYTALAKILAGAILLYLTFFIGPYADFFNQQFSQYHTRHAQARSEILQQAAAGVPTVASYSFLNRADADELYAFHYAYQGAQQFMIGEYPVPDSAHLILDFSDLLVFQDKVDQDAYLEGAQRLNRMVGTKSLIALTDTYALFADGPRNAIPLVRAAQAEPATHFQKISDAVFVGVADTVRDGAIVQARIPYYVRQSTDELLVLAVDYLDDTGKVEAQRLYPVTYGLRPSPFWEPGQSIEVMYRFLLPSDGTHEIRGQLVTLDGDYVIDALSSAQLKINDITPHSDLFTIYSR